MSGYILRGGQENITLPAAAVESLLRRGEGDAALLYLALQRFGRGVTPEELEKVLPTMSRLRLDAAERVLQELGLLPRPQTPGPEPAAEKPVYSAEDITALLTDNEGFRLLIPQTEQQLGKKLRTADLQILAGLYDDLGLPADVIYLLVGHCMERIARKYGEGRRPTLRQIEKEGYAWARMGVDTQKAAVEYLKKYTERQGAIPQYMRALGLGDRLPVASEEKYLNAWQEMGFPPETVALAYDKTVLKCHELKWPYCNGILKRWHEAGLHTPEEIERADKPQVKQPTQSAGDAWKYV